MSLQSERPLLRIGIPKGSLQNATVELFAKAGYNIHIPSRSYFPTIDDPDIQLVMFRAQEMSRYVEDGVIDMGLTGHDWVVENGSNIHEVCELAYSKQTTNPARWILAVPEESEITKPEQLEGKMIATELLETTIKYFKDKNINVKKVEFSWGATEVKARLVDAIVDVTETGSSIRANKLRIIDTLLTSTTRLICSNEAWADDAKRQKIEDLALLLRGAMAGKTMVGLKFNIAKANTSKVLAMLPAEKSPTVNDLADAEWCAMEVLLEEKVERDLIPQLRRLGATGIFSYSVDKVIPELN